MPSRGSSRRALVLAFVVAAVAWLSGCAPIPASHDASGGGGGGGVARAGWVSETHESTRREMVAREVVARASSRTETMDLRVPRMGIIYCRKCQ